MSEDDMPDIKVGDYVMMAKRNFGDRTGEPNNWTFYRASNIDKLNEPNGHFEADLVRGMLDSEWSKMDVTVHRPNSRQFSYQVWDNDEDADHAANFHNLVYRLKTMHKATFANLDSAKETTAASMIKGTDSPGDYLEFFTVLGVFASLAVKDDEEKHLLAEFYSEIEDSIEKYIAKRMLLGKSFS